MKQCFFIIFFFFYLSSFSQSANDKGPVVHPTEIVKDFMSFLYYQRDHLIWSADYVTLDTSLNTISKKEFLEQLTTGKYLPLKIRISDALPGFQLYGLEKSVDKDIVATIKNTAIKELHYYKMEGMPLPDFNFVDLDNNVYNAETAKDKIIVMNCWFVRCGPCAKEMPDLNLLAKKYEKRKDILFLALAWDPAEDVRNFLKKTSFKYAIIPDKEDYLNNTLNIIGYPTQLIINRQGMIVKVIESNKISELTDALNKEINR